MGTLPVSASVFFNDFSDDVLDYDVLSSDSIIGTYRGLNNSDEDGNYIGFLFDDHPQIDVGCTIRTHDGLEAFLIKKVLLDRYKGKPDLLKAYF